MGSHGQPASVGRAFASELVKRTVGPAEEDSEEDEGAGDDTRSVSFRCTCLSS
jgi:hypothetical protein